MGEARRRRLHGAPPRTAPHLHKRPGALTFAQAQDLTAREGGHYWTWVARVSGVRLIGADTYVSFRDDDDPESDGLPWVDFRGDDWADAHLEAEEDSMSMEEVPVEAREAPWYRTPLDPREGLEEISFLRLRELGCADPTVLEVARAFDGKV